MTNKHSGHVAQLVGESLNVLKVCLFNSQSWHLLGLQQVWSSIVVCVDGERSIFLSHLNSLPLSFYFSLSLALTNGNMSWTFTSISYTKVVSFLSFFSNRFPISFSFSLLLPAPPCCECWCAWSCPGGSLHYCHFFTFFFLLLVWVGDFFFPIFQIADLILFSKVETVFHISLLMILHNRLS